MGGITTPQTCPFPMHACYNDLPLQLHTACNCNNNMLSSPHIHEQTAYKRASGSRPTRKLLC